MIMHSYVDFKQIWLLQMIEDLYYFVCNVLWLGLQDRATVSCIEVGEEAVHGS